MIVVLSMSTVGKNKVLAFSMEQKGCESTPIASPGEKLSSKARLKRNAGGKVG